MKRFLLITAFVTGIPIFLASRAYAADCVVIHAKHVFESHSGRLLGLRYILIRLHQIASVSTNPPRNARTCARFDFPDSTILPGLIDAHTHVLTTDRSFLVDYSKELLRTVDEAQAARVATARKHLRQIIRSGITTIRDLGNSGRYGDLSLKMKINKGDISGPRIFGSGPGISTGTAQFAMGTPPETVGKEYRIIQSARDIDAAIAEHRAAGVDLIKAYADTDPTPGGMPLPLLRELANRAHAAGLKIAVHATDAISTANATEAGADSIEHGYELSDSTILEMAKRRTFLVPTDLSRQLCEEVGRHNPGSYYRPESYIQRRSSRLIRAFRAGVPIAFGSDMYFELGLDHNYGRDEKETLISYVEQGLPPNEALRSATFQSARLLGRTDLGVLKTGATADIIAVAGNPVSNIKNIQRVVFVMKNGRVVCNSENQCR